MSMSLTRLLTKPSPDARHSSARNSSLMVKARSCIFGRSYHASGVSMGTLGLCTTLCLPRSVTILMIRTCRIYNEMHTGNWWWSVQVRHTKVSILRRMLTSVLVVFGEAETWRDNNPHHLVLRQNTVDSFSFQVGISSIPYYRKHTKGCSQKAIAMCTNAGWLYPNYTP